MDAVESEKIRKDGRESLVKFFDGKDPDTVSKGIYQSALLYKMSEVGQLARQISLLTSELYYENSKHPLFDKAPEEAIQAFEVYKQSKPKKNLIINPFKRD